MNEKYKQLVSLYVRAKDRHQPHLMALTFEEDATLRMVVNTDAITFPPEAAGLENITGTLVNDFHARFNNVYTFCINESEVEFTNELRCTWLVGMTDSETGALRIGCGEYHWEFNKRKSNDEFRVRQLVIVINSMIVLPAESALVVLPWLDTLPHPWISLSDLSVSTPDVSIIHEFLEVGWRVRE